MAKSVLFLEVPSYRPTLRNSQVVHLCAYLVADALDARKNPIIIDNTFVQQWERDQYIKLVGKPILNPCILIVLIALQQYIYIYMCVVAASHLGDTPIGDR